MEADGKDDDRDAERRCALLPPAGDDIGDLSREDDDDNNEGDNEEDTL